MTAPTSSPPCRNDDFAISISDFHLEVDDRSSSQYVCGLTGTLTLRKGAESWTDQFFPIVDLALRLRSLDSLGEAFAFDSMCLEESPVVETIVDGPTSVVQLFDGTRFSAPTALVVREFEAFLDVVDAALRSRSPYSLPQLFEALRPFPLDPPDSVS